VVHPYCKDVAAHVPESGEVRLIIWNFTVQLLHIYCLT